MPLEPQQEVCVVSTCTLISNRNDLSKHIVDAGLSRFLVTPLDVLKIHFQLQVRPASSAISGTGMQSHLVREATPSTVPYYGSLWQATSSIFKEGGLKGLWRGTIPATALWVGYMAVQFPAYRYAQRVAGPWVTGTTEQGTQDTTRSKERKPNSLPLSLIAGGSSGAVATVVTYPLDWLRTRMAAEAYLPSAQRTRAADIIRNSMTAEGAQAFFKGLWPSVIQVVPSLAVTFATYEYASSFFDTMAGVASAAEHEHASASASSDDSSSGGSSTATQTRSTHAQLRSLFAGAAAGVLGKLSVYPFDTVKKRLQMQKGTTKESSDVSKRTQVYRYKGTADALISIARQEGIFRGWFKGTVPSLIKAGAAAALTFWSYEGAASWLRQQSWAVRQE